MWCLDERGPAEWILWAIVGLDVAGRSSTITCGVAIVRAECGLVFDVDFTTILSLPLGLVCIFGVGLRPMLCLLEIVGLSTGLCPMLILDT